MADFNISFKITSGHEGGYVHDPFDRGGETYRGVSRRFHPNWVGWRLVDSHKPDAKLLREDPVLDQRVMEFYKQLYWDPFEGDMMSDQFVANEMFDTAVNMGLHWAVMFLQESLNQLNLAGSYEDLEVDGYYGQASARALGIVVKSHGKAETLFKMMNVLQGARYIKIMKRNITQRRYALGWFKRVEFKRRATV